MSMTYYHFGQLTSNITCLSITYSHLDSIRIQISYIHTPTIDKGHVRDWYLDMEGTSKAKKKNKLQSLTKFKWRRVISKF